MAPKDHKNTPVDEGFDRITLAAGEFEAPVTWHVPEPEVVVPGQVWTVRGSTKVKKYVDFPVTMTVIRDTSSGALFLINAMRLDDAMNAKVLALAGSDDATVHVVRLGAYHGRADSFWRSTLGRRGVLWTLPGHALQDGVRVDRFLGRDELPLAGASLFLFNLPRPEAALILDDLRLAVFCDAVLNICSLEFCGILWKPVIKLLGFRSAVHGPDPHWAQWMTTMTSNKQVLAEYERLLQEHEFDSYVGGHGPVSHDGAHCKIRAKVRAMFS